MDQRDPNDVAAYEADLAEVTVGPIEPLQGRLVLCDYDPDWSARYEQEAARVRLALGARATRLEHVGSTSVPGLPAKPIIDMVLEVADPADEPAYAGDLEAAGYLLRLRTPDWFEHRMFRPAGAGVHLHVFPAGCSETERMVAFRDHLRRDATDRELYFQTKRELAARDWKYMQQYADAKTDVISQIMARAIGAG